MPMTNDQLRQRNRKLRARISTDDLLAAAQNLAHRILALSVYQASQRIAAYAAVNGEMSLDPVIDQALAQGKAIYLPHLDPMSLRFSPYFHGQSMRVNRFHLPEPAVDEDKMLQATELDLVLLPLVVFDENKNRIGMGGGYYDRSFEFCRHKTSKRPILIGVAHELQKVTSIRAESWDVQLDMVVTEQRVYR